TKDPAPGLSAINTAAEQNIDMRVFMKLVLQKVRAVLLLRFAPDMEAGLKEMFTDEDF
ncbi:hypothetical protein GWN42_19275, partial [candidate division KSB1 bacterium]|nr:hypothetical protein [candidate division KSB1 bacterium]